MLGDTDRTPRRALALAGGGVVGGLYEVGALLALDAIFENFTTADFDFYVGSSAGAFVAALLANDVTPAQIRDALASDAQSLPRLSGTRFVSLPWRAYLATLPRLAVTVPRLAWDLWLHWREAVLLDAFGPLLAALPAGAFTVDGVETYVRRALTRRGRSNDFRRLRRRLLIPATELDTGAIRVFGGRVNERTPISRAVAASAAIPMLYVPARIDGVDYIDAMVTKTAHAGLAADRGAQFIVVVNPLRPLVAETGTVPGLGRSGPFGIAAQALRIATQRRLKEGLARYPQTHPGTDVVVFEPYAGDLRLFDSPLMTYALRHEIIRRGFRTTVKSILAHFDRYTLLFAAHGIALRPRTAIEERSRGWSSAATLREAAPAA
jgi:predicted acylesterase/phospholipase RssA